MVQRHQWRAFFAIMLFAVGTDPAFAFQSSQQRGIAHARHGAPAAVTDDGGLFTHVLRLFSACPPH